MTRQKLFDPEEQASEPTNHVKPIVDKVRLYQVRLTVHKVGLDQVRLKWIG